MPASVIHDKTITTPPPSGGNVTVWQQLGAFVYTGTNLTRAQVDKFASIGGKWVAVLIYNDALVAQPNRNIMPGIKAWCAVNKLQVWGWYNGRGGAPDADAKAIAGLHTNLGLQGVILDLEAEYQHPKGNAALMPALVRKCRQYMPSAQIGVSTNGMNNSMIYNGRTLQPPQSFYDLGIRCLPQWYSSYYNKDGNTTPQAQMKWLKTFGGTDLNFKDSNAPSTSYRGLPLSYVHGTAEATGMENSNLDQELQDMKAAMQFGLTAGMSYYTLEAGPPTDMDKIAKYKGVLYL